LKLAEETVNQSVPRANQNPNNHKAAQPGAVKAVIEAAKDTANNDSLALYQLTNIVKMAAFACEARRVLTGIYDSKETREQIKDCAPFMNSWHEFDDVTGEVLQDVAQQLEKLGDVINSRPYEMDKVLKTGGAV
jgi:hypothetical protein